MKHLIIFLGLIICLSACAQADYKYKLENKILDCFYQQHKDNNVDVKVTIDKIEDVLIKNEILQDKTGKSYIRAIEQVRDIDDWGKTNPKLLSDFNSIGYIPSSIFCQDPTYVSMIDSTDLANSKIKYLIGIFDSIQVKGILSSKLIAEEILEVFNAKDFENDYYRTIGLIVFSNMIKMNEYVGALSRELPPPTNEEPKKIEEQNILIIQIRKENQIVADGLQVEVTDLTKLVKVFLLETSDKMEIELPIIGTQKTSRGIISVQNDNDVSYELYLSVQNELIQAYREIRDSYSREFFNSSFEKLDEEKQEIIKDLVPQQISEGGSID